MTQSGIVFFAVLDNPHDSPENLAGAVKTLRAAGPVTLTVLTPRELTADEADRFSRCGAVSVEAIVAPSMATSPGETASRVLVEKYGAAVGLFATHMSIAGNETVAKIALATGGVFSSAASGVESSDGHWITHHGVFGGEWATAWSHPHSSSLGLTLDPQPAELSSDQTPLTVHHFTVPEGELRTRITDSEPRVRKSSRPALNRAKVVVSGGRGVGSAEAFGLIEALADHLGAAVGASRAAVDSGYADKALQIGQTGVAVTPDVYIAVGISGAIQHKAGMQSAQYIVSINTDELAPLHDIADLVIVGDLFEFLPKLMDQLR